jgi:IclR family transcriptional regulator, blcABC operon repressor
VSPAPAVLRAAAILDVLAAAENGSNGQGVVVSDIARALDLPKSSTANILAALEQVGYVRRVDRSAFGLGRKLAELGGRYLSSVDQVSEFYAACRQLRHISRETARVATLDGLEVLYLARYDGTQPLRLTAGIGDRFPATVTATGKAMLADLDDAVLHDRLSGVSVLPAYTARSLTRPEDLLAEIERIRKQGYAVDDEETTEGVVCFSVAVPALTAREGRYAVSVTVLKARVTDSMRDELIAELRELAERLRNPLQPG